MQSIALSTEIDAAIWRVYEHWKRLEVFPTFLPMIREIRWEGENRLYWKEDFQGREYESRFEITLQPKENTLLWRSVSGAAQNAGTARFEPLPDGRTKLMLEMEYEPNEAWQTPKAVRKRLQEYLSGFRRYIEESINPKDPLPTPTPRLRGN